MPECIQTGEGVGDLATGDPMPRHKWHCMVNPPLFTLRLQSAAACRKCSAFSGISGAVQNDAESHGTDYAIRCRLTKTDVTRVRFCSRELTASVTRRYGDAPVFRGRATLWFLNRTVSRSGATKSRAINRTCDIDLTVLTRDSLFAISPVQWPRRFFKKNYKCKFQCNFLHTSHVAWSVSSMAVAMC